MKYALPIIAALTLLLATRAAHTAPRATFSAVQTFKSCQETTVFACGMRTPSGQTYGTAHTRTRCATYTFLPDGTATLADFPGIGDRAEYRIRRGFVHIKVFDRQGKTINRMKLPLSDDGTKLGTMTRLGGHSLPR